MKDELTIEEGAALVRKSTATLYRWIRLERLEAIDTSDGLRVRTTDLLETASRVRPGRPRVAASQKYAKRVT